MIEAALEFLRKNWQPNIQTVDGKQFSNKTFTEIKPVPDPLPGQFEVTTLAALRDIINSNVEGIALANFPLLHIVNHQEVRLLLGVSDIHGRRQVYATAKPTSYTGFQFNAFHPHEQFCIALQSHFTAAGDREYLVKMASKIQDGLISISEDDGISQQFEVRAGLSLKATETAKSRVSLAPFRTFPECDQPASEFIFRARKGKEAPELALFEADGGRWKIAAIQNIELYLRSVDIKLPIIA